MSKTTSYINRVNGITFNGNNLEEIEDMLENNKDYSFIIYPDHLIKKRFILIRIEDGESLSCRFPFKEGDFILCVSGEIIIFDPSELGELNSLLKSKVSNSTPLEGNKELK